MEVTQEELEKGTLLRAMEWGYMPLFATQVLAPASFLFFTWWHVPIALILMTWAWHPVKYALADYRVATLFCYINTSFIRWPMGIGFGIYYLLQKSHLLAALSVFWPLAVLVLMSPCPNTKIGVLQQIFVNQLVGRKDEDPNRAIDSDKK